MGNRVAVFSARPGRIKTEIAVDFPHPRHYTIKTSPEFMDLRAGESVFLCLHLKDGVPVQLEDRHVNPRVVPDFMEQDLAATPPSEYLVRHVPFDQIEHPVDAVLATAEQAARLAMPAAEPCVLLTRRTWTRTGPVTLVRCLHPASRYRLGSRFRADGNPSY